MRELSQQPITPSGNRLGWIFIVITVIAIVVMLVLSFLHHQLGVDLIVSGNAATTVGPFLGVIGIFIAVRALHASTESSELAKRATTLAERQAELSERAANPNIVAARQWLVERRKLESQLDYLFFACPYVLGQIQGTLPSAAPANPSAPITSMADATKSLLAVIGMMRRLRDALLTYSENNGLLLSMQITRSSSSKADPTSVADYLKGFDTTASTITTPYLTHIEGWLFKGTAGGSPVTLSTRTTVRAVTELICLIDYLDGRAASLNSVLEQSVNPASASHVESPSTIGQAMFDALSENVKDMYAHLAVFRACLEKEWALAFPAGTQDKRVLEDRIAHMLSDSDDERFVFGGNTTATNNAAGFRFGHALAHLENNQVFAAGPSLLNQGSATKSSNSIPARIASLYS